MSGAQEPNERERLLRNQSLEKFCEFMGIDPPTRKPNRANSIYGEVVNAHLWQKVVYYTLATVAVTILVLQIVFSATIVALAADKKDYHVTIEALGGVITVISFIAGYMKSMGQPTRARQFMEALEHVRHKIDEGYGIYRSECAEAEDPCAKARKLEMMFEEARVNALSNMPDV